MARLLWLSRFQGPGGELGGGGGGGLCASPPPACPAPLRAPTSPLHALARALQNHALANDGPAFQQLFEPSRGWPPAPPRGPGGWPAGPAGPPPPGGPLQPQPSRPPAGPAAAAAAKSPRPFGERTASGGKRPRLRVETAASDGDEGNGHAGGSSAAAAAAAAAAAGSDDGVEDDEALARRLHAELNRTPARSRRGGGGGGFGPGGGCRTAGDPRPPRHPYFGDDPGLLPSCWALARASRTPRVPFGFVCGFPVASASSEHWGYVAGQSLSHPQAVAVKAAAERWGGPGCTELPFPVCKSGYRPFEPHTGRRMVACARHDALRRAAVRAAGGQPREGWESFGQWDGDAPAAAAAAAGDVDGGFDGAACGPATAAAAGLVPAGDASGGSGGAAAAAQENGGRDCGGGGGSGGGGAGCDVAAAAAAACAAPGTAL